MEKLKDHQIEEIYHIWNRVYPQCIRYKNVGEFKTYLNGREKPFHYLEMREGQVAGWLCTFERDKTRWLALLVDHPFQKQGIGKKLLNRMKKDEQQVYGWMVPHSLYKRGDGEPYPSPMQFYLKNNFEILDVFFCSEDLMTQKISWTRFRVEGIDSV